MHFFGGAHNCSGYVLVGNCWLLVSRKNSLLLLSLLLLLTRSTAPGVFSGRNDDAASGQVTGTGGGSRAKGLG